MDRNNLTHKDILLKTFQAFLYFCEKYNLKYVAAYGTVLGAIRHKGLIPWDDDIDVYMPIEDFNRFLSLKTELRGTEFEIFDYSDNGAYMSYAKFCDKNTTIWEYENRPFVLGVFIDIFPLYKTADSLMETYKKDKAGRRIWDNYVKSILSLSGDQLKLAIKRLDIVYLLKCGYFFFIYRWRRRFYLNKFLKYSKGLEDFHGEDYFAFCADKDVRKNILLNAWIENTIVVPFEGLSISIPKDYDGYLKFQYGDYMQLPPLEKRLPHCSYYINLSRRLQIDEILNLIKVK